MPTIRIQRRIQRRLQRSGGPSARTIGVLLLLVGAQISWGSTAFVATARAANDSSGGSAGNTGETMIRLAQLDADGGSEETYEDASEPPTDSAEKPTVTRPLEPRYQPRPPVEKSWYNANYLFGMTRGVADSTIAPAGKVPLFFLTVPLDIVLLPFAAIGGLFG